MGYYLNDLRFDGNVQKYILIMISQLPKYPSLK